jgi:plasmid stability protein
MGQMLVRQLDDEALERLKRRAKELNTSAEALAREAIHKAAELSVEQKLALVRRSHEWSRRVQRPGVPQSLGVDLIREDRDNDH